jgi:crotonobetainyl-CoA:carnitine CoA-transferase CaiB-like acyl-CoA transferase
MVPAGNGKPRPLAGVRVLDISTMIAAPLTASLLADWGAEVVKVERPRYGDHVRHFGAQAHGEGLYWKTLARNKRSVALDLRTQAGQAIFRRWLPKFDVLVENFRPGTLERWGLDPAELRQIAPQLVILRLTAFGQDGPYRDRPGFGTLAEAMSGYTAASGFPDRPPLLPSVPLADVLAGLLGAGAICASLVRAARGGGGETIDLAIYEAMLKLVELQIVEYDQKGTLHRRLGNRIEDVAPRGAYECSDGRWIALSASTQPVAEGVLRAIGGEDLVADPRFRTNVERVEHAEEIDELLGRWCAQRTRDEALRVLGAMGGAVGPLENIATMLENPQVIDRGSIATVNDPVLGPVRMTAAYPAFLESAPAGLETGPSAVGADTVAVLARDLGLSAAELAELREAGAVDWLEPAAEAP